MRRLGKGRFRFFRGQRGVSLVEALIAVAILAMVGIAFLQGLTATSRAVMLCQERVAAESLATSQIERIRVQDYIPVAAYDNVTNCYEEIDIPADLVGQYDIAINTPEIIIEAGVDGPFELQSITVVIKRNGEGVFTMSIYKYGSTAS